MKNICIEMQNGKKIYCELFDTIAPITVGNFLHLVDIGFYNGTIFHRVIKDFMSQCGGYVSVPEGIMALNNSYTIPGEFIENGFKDNTLSHVCGVLSMARTPEPNSANSQFFICSKNATFLDGKYAAFGKIIDEVSLQVAEEINSINTSDIGGGFTDFPNGETVEDITIKSIYRV